MPAFSAPSWVRTSFVAYKYMYVHQQKSFVVLFSFTWLPNISRSGPWRLYLRQVICEYFLLYYLLKLTDTCGKPASSPALYLRVSSATINTTLDVTPLAKANFKGNYDGSYTDLARYMGAGGKEGLYPEGTSVPEKTSIFAHIYFSSLPSKSPLTLLYHHSSATSWSISDGAWHG